MQHVVAPSGAMRAGRLPAHHALAALFENGASQGFRKKVGTHLIGWALNERKLLGVLPKPMPLEVIRLGAVREALIGR